MSAFPSVAFASINSKVDREQIATYRAIAMEMLLPGADLDGDGYFAMLNRVLERRSLSRHHHQHLRRCERLRTGYAHEGRIELLGRASAAWGESPEGLVGARLGEPGSVRSD